MSSFFVVYQTFIGLKSILFWKKTNSRNLLRMLKGENNPLLLSDEIGFLIFIFLWIGQILQAHWVEDSMNLVECFLTDVISGLSCLLFNGIIRFGVIWEIILGFFLTFFIWKIEQKWLSGKYRWKVQKANKITKYKKWNAMEFEILFEVERLSTLLVKNQQHFSLQKSIKTSVFRCNDFILVIGHPHL